jgi:hypothetical protein
MYTHTLVRALAYSAPFRSPHPSLCVAPCHPTSRPSNFSTCRHHCLVLDLLLDFLGSWFSASYFYCFGHSSSTSIMTTLPSCLLNFPRCLKSPHALPSLSFVYKVQTSRWSMVDREWSECWNIQTECTTDLLEKVHSLEVKKENSHRKRSNVDLVKPDK